MWHIYRDRLTHWFIPLVMHSNHDWIWQLLLVLLQTLPLHISDQNFFDPTSLNSFIYLSICFIQKQKLPEWFLRLAIVWHYLCLEVMHMWCFYVDIKSVLQHSGHTRVPGQAALRAVGRALVQRVLECSVVVHGGSVVIWRTGFLTQLAVLAVGALQTCSRFWNKVQRR